MTTREPYGKPVQVFSYNLENATAVGVMHRELNPQHILVIIICDACQRPIGLFCRTCRTPLAYIRDECNHKPPEGTPGGTPDGSK